MRFFSFLNTLLILFIPFFLISCSPKSIFPTDNKEYDSISNYNYTYETHEFYSKDMTKLYGLYIKTSNKSNGTIVVTNGIYENMSNRFNKWLWVVDNNYDLFIFDYRGYGKSTSEVDLIGFRDDVNAAVEYAHLLNEQNKIILIGQSMGGTFVIDALSKKEYKYVSLLVVDSTFTSFDSILGSFMMKSIILFPLSWIPYSFSYYNLNSIDNVASINTPKLFITGDDDWIVNYSNSKELYSKAQGEKELWIVDGVGHVESFDNLSVRKSFLNLLTDTKAPSLEGERYFY